MNEKTAAVLTLALGFPLGGCFAFGPPDGYECTQKSDCDDGHVCVEAECLRVCTLQIHCDSGTFCSQDGVCVATTEPPRISAPVGLSAHGGAKQVALVWEPVSGARSYNLYWDQLSGVTPGSSRVSSVTSPFVYGPLANGTTYYFAVTAVDVSSESVLSDEVSATTLAEPAKLVALDAQPEERFGISVALSADFAIVGAFDSYPQDSPGAAYVFHRTGANTWGAPAELAASDGHPGDSFGGSVALSGDLAVVGGGGGAYVFRRTGDNSWEEETKLLKPDDVFLEFFGESVAISGNYAVVGSDSGASGTGAAYVFHRTQEGDWDAGTRLVAAGARTPDRTGGVVALDGDYAVTGSFDEGPWSDRTGAAFVFHRTSEGDNTWDQGTKLVAPDAADGDWFGGSVAVSGKYAIVGAHLEDGGEGDPLRSAGAAYVFRRSGTNTWDSGTKLVAADAQADDHFGRSVALSGDYAIVSAKQSSFLFRRTGVNDWTGATVVEPGVLPDDDFGSSVALTGTHAIVGAAGMDLGDSMADAGAAYVFSY